MKRFIFAVLILAQLVFDVYAVYRMNGIEDYLANDWKGSDISDRVSNLEDAFNGFAWTLEEGE